MKKIIALLVVVLCVFSTFSVSAGPFKPTGDESVTISMLAEFSDDYSKFVYNGFNYTQFNDNQMTGDIETTSVRVKLTAEQQEKFSSVELDVSNQNDIIHAYYSLKNGGHISFSYLKDEYIGSYNVAMQNNWETAKIDFIWPEGNRLTVNRQTLKQNKTSLSIYDYSDCFDVYVPIGDKGFGISKGSLYTVEDEYYYVDYSDAGIIYDGGFDVTEYPNLSAYKITDAALCNDIKSAIEKNYGEELGFFDDDKFTKKVSDVFLVVIFAIIPFAIFLLFLILSLRSKTRYKQFFAWISIFSVIEFIIFVVLTVLFIVLKA